MPVAKMGVFVIRLKFLLGGNELVRFNGLMTMMSRNTKLHDSTRTHLLPNVRCQSYIASALCLEADQVAHPDGYTRNQSGL